MLLHYVTWCKSNCLKFSERAIIVQEEGLDAFTTFLGHAQQSYHTMWYRVLVQSRTIHLSQHISVISSEIGDNAHCGPCCGTEDLSISFHCFFIFLPATCHHGTKKRDACRSSSSCIATRSYSCSQVAWMRRVHWWFDGGTLTLRPTMTQASTAGEMGEFVTSFLSFLVQLLNE